MCSRGELICFDNAPVPFTPTTNKDKPSQNRLLGVPIIVMNKLKLCDGEKFLITAETVGSMTIKN